MTLLAVLVLAQASAASPAAEFFPLVKGTRRTYEKKGEGTLTVVDEVGSTVYFEDRPAVALIQKDAFGRVVDTSYYRVDGSSVFMVGIGEDRTNSTSNIGDKKGEANVLLSLVPAMPVFKYEGKETPWGFAGVPQVQARVNESSRPGEPTEIKGMTRPGKPRKVLGRTVDTIEVRADVQIGTGELAQKIVETSVYGRGIGLIESTFRSTVDGKTREIRTKLVSIEEKKDGG